MEFLSIALLLFSMIHLRLSSAPLLFHIVTLPLLLGGAVTKRASCVSISWLCSCNTLLPAPNHVTCLRSCSPAHGGGVAGARHWLLGAVASCSFPLATVSPGRTLCISRYLFLSTDMCIHGLTFVLEQRSTHHHNLLSHSCAFCTMVLQYPLIIIPYLYQALTFTFLVFRLLASSSTYKILHLYRLYTLENSTFYSNVSPDLD